LDETVHRVGIGLGNLNGVEHDQHRPDAMRDPITDDPAELVERVDIEAPARGRAGERLADVVTQRAEFGAGVRKLQRDLADHFEQQLARIARLDRRAVEVQVRKRERIAFVKRVIQHEFRD
jgi:hypothetical protein